MRAAHECVDNKTNLITQIDSIVIEEHTRKSDIVPCSVNIQPGTIQHPHEWTKRTIKVYGLHKCVISNNKIVSEEKVQVKKKGTIKTSVKTKEEKTSSNGTFIAILIVLLCLLMIAGLVCWKIAVQ